MPTERLRALLDEQGVDYQVDEHPKAYTAQEVAASEHVTGWRVAKTVILQADGELVMVVAPAAAEIDLEKATAVLDASEVQLASESQFADAFPDCEVGAEPPFGHLYGVRTLVDERLTREPHVVFRAGTHTETVRMWIDDYLRLVDAQQVDVATLPE